MHVFKELSVVNVPDCGKGNGSPILDRSCGARDVHGFLAVSLPVTYIWLQIQIVQLFQLFIASLLCDMHS